MNFYNLSKDDNYESAEYSDEVDWESIKCPVYEGHQRAGKRIGDLEIKLKGPINREFFWTILSELVVTENFVDMAKESGLTGFETKLAKVVNKKSDIEFFEFIPTGKGGFAHNIRLVSKCEYCGAEEYKEKDQPNDKFVPLKKILINKALWDGSDIFTVTGLSRFILITERMKELIINSKLKGSVITKAENFLEKVYPNSQ